MNTLKTLTRARKALALAVAHSADVETERAYKRAARRERAARRSYKEALRYGDAFEGEF